MANFLIDSKEQKSPILLSLLLYNTEIQDLLRERSILEMLGEELNMSHACNVKTLKTNECSTAMIVIMSLLLFMLIQ